MDFRLLGPLDVRDGERTITLGGRRQRALLAMLLLHANEVVSVDRLCDAMWGDQLPATGVKTVQIHVSRLRRTLGADRVVTRAPGYLLRVEDGETDAQRFGRLVAEGGGPPGETAARLRTALALWRGPPLADLADEEFAQSEIARLTEMRVAAVEARVDADVELGRHADLVGELDGLILEHPLRELYGEALGLADDPIQRAELLLAIGEVSARAGDTPASKRAFLEAADLATAHDLPDHLAQAAIGYGGRIIWNVSRDDPTLAELLERALSAIPAEDGATRVRLLVRFAGGPLRDTRVPPERRRAISAEALAAARRLGDDATLAFGLHGYILGHHGPAHTP